MFEYALSGSGMGTPGLKGWCVGMRMQIFLPY